MAHAITGNNSQRSGTTSAAAKMPAVISEGITRKEEADEKSSFVEDDATDQGRAAPAD